MKRNFGISFLVVALAISGAALAQQKRNTERSNMVKSNQPTKPQAGIAQRMCNQSRITLTKNTLILNCDKMNDLGIDKYFVPLARNTGKLNANMVLELAQTELSEKNRVLEIQFDRTKKPEGKFCASRAFADKTCREALQISLAPGN